MSVRRDPETGRYVSGMPDVPCDEMELLTFWKQIEVLASDLPPTSAQEVFQVEIADLDDLLDRHESAELIGGEIFTTAYPGGFVDAADAEHVRAISEISAQPNRAIDMGLSASGGSGSYGGDPPATLESSSDDSFDLLYRPMYIDVATMFEDSSNGTAANIAGNRMDQVGGMPADPEFRPRDELFWNLTARFLESGTYGWTFDLAGQLLFEIDSTDRC